MCRASRVIGYHEVDRTKKEKQISTASMIIISFDDDDVADDDYAVDDDDDVGEQSGSVQLRTKSSHKGKQQGM